MDGSVLAGSNSNIRNSSGDQKHRFVITFKAQVPVRVSLCPSAMHASLRLISAAERLCLPNRPFVRDRLILLLLPTMRRVRSTFLLSFPKVISGMARTTMMLPKSLMNSPALWDLFPWPRTTLLKFSPIFKRELCAASQQDSRVHVCFGSKADMCSAKGHVRFTPESGHVRSARDVRFGPILLHKSVAEFFGQ